MPTDRDLLSELRSRRAFGVRPNLLENPHVAAAENLVAKALRVWHTEAERAAAYVARAAQFPYNDDERDFPALWAAHMALFNEVSDAAEESPVDDIRWLDAAIDVLGTADPRGRLELAAVLRNIAHDYHLTRREKNALRAACAAIPRLPESVDTTLTPDEVSRIALSIIATTAAYAPVLAETRGQPRPPER